MVNLVFLQVLLTEMLRLSQLTGNCGRVIARFFERRFPRDTFTFLCELPRGGAHLEAVYLARLHAGLDSVALLLREDGVVVRIERDALDPQSPNTFVRITLADPLPAGVRDRCRLLGQLEAAFRLLSSVASCTEEQLALEWNRRTQDTGDAAATAMTEAHLQYLDEVLRGEDQNLCHLPFTLIWLIEDTLPDARGQLFTRLLATN